MGVALDRSAAFDLALQLTEAAEELVVELLLLAQLSGLPRERLLSTGEFLRESGDDGLRLTEGLRFQLSDAVGEAMDETDDGVNALCVNPSDMSLTE